MVDVRAAAPSDIGALSQALARAFHDDPVMEYLFQPGPKRSRHIARFMATTATRDMKHGEVSTTAAIEGGALWSAPDQWKLSILEILRMGPDVLPAFGRRLPRALRTLSMIEKVHPKAPHWYLGVLGTDTAHQGKGIGSALLAPVLERCDQEGLPAYLESSKERNVPFYARHGFTVTHDTSFPDGPTVWGMWREPR